MLLNSTPVFLKHPWSNTRSTLCSIWENNLETFKKLFSIINHVAVFTVISWNHYTEILHWNIHELWHQALIAMKITMHSLIFQNTVMIYKTRNHNNDARESQKETKICFNAYAGGKWNLTIRYIGSKQIRCGH